MKLHFIDYLFPFAKIPTVPTASVPLRISLSSHTSVPMLQGSSQRENHSCSYGSGSNAALETTTIKGCLCYLDFDDVIK